MRKFLVKVNGNDYEVEVEEIIGAGQFKEGKPAGPVVATQLDAAPAAKPAPASVSPAAEKPAAAAGSICAPMPGTILSVSVKAGQTVKKGDVLAVLEAMKMENEILASADGTVTAVYVTPNSSVETGSPIASLS